MARPIDMAVIWRPWLPHHQTVTHGPICRPGGSGMITGAAIATGAGLVGFVVVASCLQRSMRAHASQLEVLACSDVLTGLYNRRLLDNLPPVFDGRPTDVWVAYGDLDKFKRVNDDLGHCAGDAVLAGIARTIADTIRPDDLVCRMGGDEFVVLLRACDETGARQVLERIQMRMSDLDMDCVGGPVTISFGLSAVGPTLVTTEAISEADRALLVAKRSGGNAVVLAPILRCS